MATASPTTRKSCSTSSGWGGRPSLPWATSSRRRERQVNILGKAGLMFQVNYSVRR